MSTEKAPLQRKMQSESGDTSSILGEFHEKLRRLQSAAEIVLIKTQRENERAQNRRQRHTSEQILERAQRLRSEIEAQVQGITRTLDARAQGVFGALLQESMTQLVVLLKRLNPSSRKEIQRLIRRIEFLERQLKLRRTRRRTTRQGPRT